MSKKEKELPFTKDDPFLTTKLCLQMHRNSGLIPDSEYDNAIEMLNAKGRLDKLYRTNKELREAIEHLKEIYRHIDRIELALKGEFDQL